MEYIKNGGNRLSCIWALAFFGATFFIYFDFNIRMIFGYGILTAFIFMCTVSQGKLYLIKEKSILLFLVMMISTFIFLGNGNEGTVEYAIGMDLCAIIAIIYTPQEKQYLNALKLLFVFSVVFSLYSILMFVFPNLYKSIVSPIISEGARQYNAALIRDGYGVALGANAAYIDYVAAVGVIFAVSSILNQIWFIRSQTAQFAGVIISLMGMLCVNRKGELLGLIIAIIVIFRVQYKRGDRITRRRTRRFASAAVIIALVACVFLGARGYLLRFYLFFNKILRNLSNDRVDITSGRIYIWKYALGIFKKNPILGIGWEQFRAVLPAYDIDTVKVHNNFIQLLCETGVVGFILIAIPMTALLVITYCEADGYFKHGGDQKVVKVAYMVSLGMQVFFFVLDFLDPCIYKMHFWPIYTISIMSLIFARYYDICEQMVSFDDLKSER